jgi:hypothetical protein
MEVEIVDSHGIKPEHIVMLRAGQTRRQAKLGAKMPFQFPVLPVHASPLKVEIYQPIGSKGITLSPEANFYNVRTPASEDGTAQASKLQLLIRQAEEVATTNDDDCPVCEKEKTRELTNKAGQPEDKSEEVQRKVEAGVAAREYLKKTRNCEVYPRDVGGCH